MISVAEALVKVKAGFSVVSSEQIGLADGLGRVLSEDVAARVSHPPMAVSAMDGYAVRALDVAGAPVDLKQIGESQAGAGFGGTVKTGETVRIFTGALLPAGADAIVMQENTKADGAQIQINESVEPGKFVRPAGMDFSEGELLLKAGTILSARDLGLVAAMNVPSLKVRRRPRVAFTATGEELSMPGGNLSPDQIVSSNSFAVAAYIETLGGVPLNLGITRDDEGSLRQVIASAKGADLLLTIGGASVGDYDFVSKLMVESEANLSFYKVAMRPGKPLIFGRLGGVPLLGLPGNPVSVGVTAIIFLKAAMNTMLGADEAEAMENAVLDCELPANDHRQDYLRAVFAHDAEGHSVVRPFGPQDSAMMARLAEADCLVIRPPEAPAAKAGDRVDILRFLLSTRTF